MLEDSINYIPDQIKVSRYKSAKMISSLMKPSPKIKEIPKKRSHSYDNINKKLENKFSISKTFPISESYSLISNSHEDILHFNFMGQSNKNKNYKKYKTFDHNEREPEIKKICSSNLVNSSNKLREEFLVENNQESEKNIRIKIKRPNFLIKSCFYNKNSDIYQSKIGRSMSKKENFPVFNFFREIDVEPNMNLLKKNYKLSSFRKPQIKSKEKNNNIDNNILNDELLNDNEELIKIIKADSSDDEKEVKSFHGDNFDFANEIEKINKLKDKEDTLNDSININKNNNSIYSAQNFSEGLNNSNYLNRSLNEDFVFKNHSKIFKSNNNNLSMSFNNSIIKAQEDKINNAIYENNNIIQDKNNENYNDEYSNYINSSNLINNNNFGSYQGFENEINKQNFSYQNINNNFINNNENNPININNKFQFQNSINQNNDNHLNVSNNFQGKTDCLDWNKTAEGYGLQAKRSSDVNNAQKLITSAQNSNKQEYVLIQVPITIGKGDGKKDIDHWVGHSGKTITKKGEVWIEIVPTSDNDAYRDQKNSNWIKKNGKMYVKESAIKGAVVVKNK